MKPLSKFWKIVLSIAVGSIIQFLAIHPIIFEAMPTYMEYIIVLAAVGGQILITYFFDTVPLEKINFSLGNKYQQSEKELGELREVIFSFMEHSEIYHQRIRDLLKINEDYVCIVKSSEGFSDVWKELSNDEKRPLPFTTTLANLTGAVRPFENMGMFLIPTATLKGVRKMPLRDYIQKHIIPKVNIERKKFLKSLPKDLSKKVGEFSYKYMAFYLRKDAIAHDVTKNRKFSREFGDFIINEQVGYRLDKMKSELADVIKGKEILSLTSWSSFAKLNPERETFIEKYKSVISDALEKQGVIGLKDLAAADPLKISRIIWTCLKKSQKETTTELKVKNLSKTVVEGARKTINVLQRSGVYL